jgi:hypothetical protein
MGASIHIKDKARKDDRFKVAADVLGLGDPDFALIKIGHLWAKCTETQHYTLSQAYVRATLGPAGLDALLVSDLAEMVDEHLPTKWQRSSGVPLPVDCPGLDIRPTPARPGEQVVRLRGTEGAIEWYGQILCAASNGGNKRARLAAERNAEESATTQKTSRTAKRPASRAECRTDSARHAEQLAGRQSARQPYSLSDQIPDQEIEFPGPEPRDPDSLREDVREFVDRAAEPVDEAVDSDPEAPDRKPARRAGFATTADIIADLEGQGLSNLIPMSIAAKRGL